jgi:hypothetical protein
MKKVKNGAYGSAQVGFGGLLHISQLWTCAICHLDVANGTGDFCHQCHVHKQMESERIFSFLKHITY